MTYIIRDDHVRNRTTIVGEFNHPELAHDLLESMLRLRANAGWLVTYHPDTLGGDVTSPTGNCISTYTLH